MGVVNSVFKDFNILPICDIFPSCFSLGLAIPEENKVFVKETTYMPIDDGVALFNSEDTAMLIAPW